MQLHAITLQQSGMMVTWTAEVGMGWHGKFLWNGKRDEIMREGVGLEKSTEMFWER